MNDPYRTLGLRSNASDADIKKAYRKLARENHPDLDPGNPAAEEKFKDISAAYDLLSDPVARGQYDRGEIDASGAKSRSRTSGFGGFGGFRQGGANPFSSKGKRPNIRVNGADVEYSLGIDFLDAAKGGVKHISTTNGKRLKVSVPAGIGDGATLRLKGQGMPGFGGGKPGDALVDIEIKPDPTFRREETDIHLDLPVSLSEAVLGAKIEVPTIDGIVSLTVPASSNTGTILRLKGKGMPLAGKDSQRGDQYVTLKVVLPKEQDDEFRSFVESWSKKNPYEVFRRRTETS